MSEQTSRAVSPLRQRMIDDMRMRKMEPRTQEGYIRGVYLQAVVLRPYPHPRPCPALGRGGTPARLPLHCHPGPRQREFRSGQIGGTRRNVRVAILR